MRKMLNKKGFSLVELMIVVVIMGILIAVAIP
ncbi:MAG: prepilin-type N-terminal cleavage/methylation domain-containing protein, partial [Clostridia bacterium]|nr:prepilin-type N-terminal cleavage/methylation domain-containing protein [Clostridia bacterium]